MGILDLPGPDFLNFYIVCVGVAVVLGLILRAALRGMGGMVPAEVSQLEPLEVACLTGGERLAVNTAIATLYRRGAVRLTGKTRSLEASKSFAGQVHPLEAAIYRFVAAAPAREINAIHRDVSVESVMQRPQRLGLMLPTGRRRASALMSALPLIALLVLAGMKIAIGISRHRPVEFLVLLAFMTLVGIIVFLVKAPRRTRMGDVALKALKQRNAALRATTMSSPGTLAVGELALAMGLFGPVVLSVGEMGDLRQAIMPANAAGTSCSSGCGGGSSGCGGGGSCGGGGGCGGCGGGGGD
jgi:uncharacterized protein (TIGR04222 family)